MAEKKKPSPRKKTGKTAKPKPETAKNENAEKTIKERPLKFVRGAAKNRFLNVFANTGNVKKACAIAGISRTTHYKWMHEDDEYCVAFEKARGIAADLLEDEAWRRAVDGDEVPIINGKGEKVGSRFYRSDKLLEVLLKANNPKKFGTERIQQENIGEVEIRWMNDDEDETEE